MKPHGLECPPELINHKAAKCPIWSWRLQLAMEHFCSLRLLCTVSCYMCICTYHVHMHVCVPIIYMYMYINYTCTFTCTYMYHVHVKSSAAASQLSWELVCIDSSKDSAPVKSNLLTWRALWCVDYCAVEAAL